MSQVAFSVLFAFVVYSKRAIYFLLLLFMMMFQKEHQALVSSIATGALITIVATLAGVYGLLNLSEARLLERQYAQYGSKENFELAQKAQLKQFNEQIESIKEYVAGGANPNAPTQQEPENGPATFADTDLSAVKDGAYIAGDASAEILLVEYSDMECPFCIRQYNESRAIQEVVAKYGSKVATIFKNYRAVPATAHPGAQAKAIGALCAGKIGGTTAYNKFIGGVFAKSTLQSVVPVSELPTIATESGIDAAAWQACVNSDEMTARFAAENAEAVRFNVGGTPGTLIINTKTLKTAFVSGAYPKETFFEKIDSLLN